MIRFFQMTLLREFETVGQRAVQRGNSYARDLLEERRLWPNHTLEPTATPLSVYARLRIHRHSFFSLWLSFEPLGITAMDEATEQFEKAVEAQARFVELLGRLTDAGRTEWLRSAEDPVFVYCLVDAEDLITFECTGGEKGDEPVPPTEPLAGIVSHYCNTTYLWLGALPESANWERLLQLLHSAKVDEDRFIRCRRIAHESPVRTLESKLKI